MRPYLNEIGHLFPFKKIVIVSLYYDSSNKSVDSPTQSSLKPNAKTSTNVSDYNFQARVMASVLHLSWFCDCCVLLCDLIGALYVQYWHGTPSTTVKLIHSLHC